MQTDEMITFEKVSFTYEMADRDKRAGGSLHNVSIRIRKGEAVLLTGPSGCGKTTVLRLVNGLIPKYYPGTIDGEIMVAGERVQGKELFDTAKLCGMVFQNPRSQFFNVDTTSELAFGCENQGVPAEEIDRRIEASVSSFGLQELVGRSIFKLSGGEKQQIACASVDVLGSGIVLLDEPSANLDYDAMEKLKGILAAWKRAGKTILIAEHRISYLWGLIDRAVIMREGEIMEELSGDRLSQITDDELLSMGLRSKRRERPEEIDLPQIERDDGRIVLTDFAFSYQRGMFEKKGSRRVLDIKQLELADGKITAVVGSNGSGKTTFLNCLCGLERNCEGRMEYRGKSYDRKARMKKVFMVFQDTNHQLFTESVMEEVRISMPSDTPDADRKVLEILESLDLAAFADRHPMSLSGGQKQRLAICCAIASGKEILLFDEPISGLDHFHMKEVSELLKKLMNSNITILVVTHDSELIRSCCDRMLVLR